MLIKQMSLIACHLLDTHKRLYGERNFINTDDGAFTGKTMFHQSSHNASHEFNWEEGIKDAH